MWDFPLSPLLLFSEGSSASSLSNSALEQSASEVVPTAPDVLERKVCHKVDFFINGVRLERLTCEAVRSAAR